MLVPILNRVPADSVISGAGRLVFESDRKAERERPEERPRIGISRRTRPQSPNNLGALEIADVGVLIENGAALPERRREIQPASAPAFQASDILPRPGGTRRQRARNRQSAESPVGIRPLDTSRESGRRKDLFLRIRASNPSIRGQRNHRQNGESG